MALDLRPEPQQRLLEIVLWFLLGLFTFMPGALLDIVGR